MEGEKKVSANHMFPYIMITGGSWTPPDYPAICSIIGEIVGDGGGSLSSMVLLFKYSATMQKYLWFVFYTFFDTEFFLRDFFDSIRDF